MCSSDLQGSVPITLFGLGSQLRIKETTKQVQHEATSCIGSYRTNTNREVPKGNDDHVTNGNGVRTVVFPTSVSLVEPDAKGFDLHTPGLVSDATQVPMQVQAYSGQEIYRQMISKNTSPNSDTSIGTDSVTETDSPQHTGHVFVVALEDANVGMEIDHQSVASSAPGETAEEMEAALATLQAANVTVIVGCTYYATSVAMLTGLEALDYSPLATTMSSTLDTDNFAALVAGGWWQAEYAIGYATWHRSSTTRGDFSGMTSEEFASAYEARYDDVTVPYQGASQFAAAVALADAIQKAGTLDTEAVAAQLRVQDLTEFYGQLSYDEYGQIQGDMVVLQWLPDGPADATEAGSGLGLIYPLRLATGEIAFPPPPWAWWKKW